MVPRGLPDSQPDSPLAPAGHDAVAVRVQVTSSFTRASLAVVVNHAGKSSSSPKNTPMGNSMASNGSARTRSPRSAAWTSR